MGHTATSLLINKPWLDFTGRSLEHEFGNGWTHGFTRSIVTLYGAVPLFLSYTTNFTLEYRLRRYDGVYRWIIDKECRDIHRKDSSWATWEAA